MDSYLWRSEQQEINKVPLAALDTGNVTSDDQLIRSLRDRFLSLNISAAAN
jgi:post-segregation antitoxin (ccd killing protein)